MLIDAIECSPLWTVSFLKKMVFNYIRTLAKDKPAILPASSIFHGACYTSLTEMSFFVSVADIE